MIILDYSLLFTCNCGYVFQIRIDKLKELHLLKYVILISPLLGAEELKVFTALQDK